MPPFLTDGNLISSVAYNLVKNVLGEPNTDNSGIATLSLENVQGFPEDAVFVPEGARNYKEFAAFRVSDNGAGFSQDKNWLEYFTRCPEKRQHGFGLYFTGLVAKMLRAPIGISSKPGNTRVSFYQPIYPN